MTLRDVLLQSCSRFPDRPALSYVFGTPVTYSEMWHQVEFLQDMLRSLGVGNGDKVAILAGNMPNWAVAYYGIVSMGAVAVPILPDFHPDEVLNILTHSESKLFFVSEKMKEVVRPKEVPTIKHVVLLDDLSILFGPEPSDTPSEKEPYLPTASDLAAIIYTSGTTGRSKGVMLSHRNIVFDVIQCQTIHKVVPEDVFLSVLPLSHTYENTLGLHLAIACGASIYYLEKPPTASALVPAMQKVRPTLMLSVPLIIEKIYRNQILAKFNANKWTTAVYRFPPARKLLHRIAGKKLYQTFGGRLTFFGIGGARLDYQAERFLKEGGFPYAIGYGLTETAPLIAGADSFKTRLQSTGPPMKGVEMTIHEPDPHTGIGEIMVKGDNIMMGYYKEPEMTRAMFTDDGWFRTGDLGCFDKDRYLYIKGRSKTVILGASGENIYPEDIESVLNNFQGVIESLVLQQKGRLVAIVHLNREEFEKQFNHLREEAKSYLHEKADEWLEEMKKKVNPKLNKFSQIHKIKSVSEPFEKTPTQKIKRYLYGNKNEKT